MKAILALLLAAAPLASSAISPAGAEPRSRLERANIAVALGYIDMVWNQHKPIEGFAKFVHPQQLKHPGKPGGSNPQGIAKLLSRHPDFRYDVKRVLADGDYVVVHSLLTGVPGLGTPVHSPQPGAVERLKVGDEVVDIYRIRDGKIVEHWDTVEAIGGTAEGVF